MGFGSRARLIKDALTYLDSLANEADSPLLEREVSDVQGNEYQNNLGDTGAALQSANKAVTVANRLLERDRSLPALNSAAAAFSTDGSVLYSTGYLAAAGAAYNRAIGLRQ